MGNLLKMEWYKLRKQRAFKVLLLVVVGLAIFSALAEGDLMLSDSGKMGLANAFADIFMLLPGAVFAGFYFGGDFAHKTIQTLLAQGYSRSQVLWAKTIVFWVGISIMLLLYPLITVVVKTIEFGWGEAFTMASVGYILRVLILGSILNLGTTSVFILIAFLCRDIPKTICFCLAFPVVFSGFSATVGQWVPMIGKLIGWSTLAQLQEITAANLSFTDVLLALLSAGVTMLVMLFLSQMLFAKAEI